MEGMNVCPRKIIQMQIWTTSVLLICVALHRYEMSERSIVFAGFAVVTLP